jgi:hypothetical protein
MKLHAFADRVQDVDDDLGRHHALDVYRIIAMLTEEEYALVHQNIQKHEASRPILRARVIIATYFSSPTAVGALRLREHSLFTPRMDVDKLVETLADLFR